MKYPEIYDISAKKPIKILHCSRVSCDISLKSISTARIETTIDEGVKFGDWVKIYYPNGDFGIYRANIPENAYESGKAAITLDNGMATLSDNLINVGDSYDENGISQPTYFEGTVTQVFTKMLSYQKTKHWQLGTVESSEQMKIDVDFDNLLTKLNDAMSQIPDYYMKYDQSSYPWKIHIVKYPTKVSAEGRLSRNVTSAKVRYDDSDLCTRVYCEALKAGHMDSANISKYGIREQRHYLTDVDEATAKKACKLYLRQREKPKVSVTIDGADFSEITGVSLDRIKVGDLYRLVIPSRNLTIEEQIVRVSYNDIISQPYALSVTLAREREDFTTIVARNSARSTSNSTANRKAGTKVMHVYEKLEKEAIVTTEHGDVLRKAGIQYDENGVLIFAKELGMDNNAGTVHAKEGQTRVLLKKAEDDASANVASIPDGDSVYIVSKGAVWSKVLYKSQEGYIRSEYLTEGIEKLSGAFNVTAERLTSDYSNKITGVESHLEQTAEHFNTTIESTRDGLQTQINQTKDSISLVVDDKTGKITPAKIVTSINKEAKTSSILLSADAISLYGTTRISDIFTVTNGYVSIKQKLRVDGEAMIGTLTLRSGSDSTSISEADLAGMIKKARLTNGGKNLVLTPVTGAEITFSKAVTAMNGVWSSGVLTVTPQPQGTPTYKSILSTGSKTLSGKVYTVPINAAHGSSGQYSDGQVWSVTVNASDVYDDGYDDGYKVTSSQVSGSISGTVPKSAGSSVISGRRDLGTVTRPSVASYLLCTVNVHGASIDCYMTLN